MRPASYFLMVLGVCYLVMMGIEYHHHHQGQNWNVAKAKVENAINSLPITKYKPNQLNSSICIFINWSYIKYTYDIGQGHYDEEKELGPHLTVIDYIIGPLARRISPGDEIEIRYDPRNPKESRIGLDVFRPIENFGGSGLVFIAIGLLMLYMNKINASTMTDDEELNQSLDYFEKKRRSIR